jgi:microcompartment protein CcmL/EutN
MGDALALLELDSVAVGLRVLDVLVKEAPVAIIEANLVEPGKFLILFTGGVAEVESSYRVALDGAGGMLLASVLLPMVHSDLVAGLKGAEDRDDPQALGVVEGRDVANTIVAADRTLKDADVSLVGIRIAVGLGGRAFFIVSGEHHDVAAGLAVAESVLESAETLHRVELIARPHAEMVPWLLRPAPFRVG